MFDKSKVNEMSNEQKEIRTYRKINTLCLIMLAGVSFTFILYYMRSILVPLTIAIFIFTMITPLIRFIRYKTRSPKWLSVILASIVIVIPLIFLFLFLTDSVSNFVQMARTYQDRILKLLNTLSATLRSYKIPLPVDIIEFSSLKQVFSGPYYANFLKSFGASAMVFFSYSFLVFIFLFFFLIGSGATKITNGILKEIQNNISKYLYIHIIISLLTGASVWIVYMACGLELAGVFATLTIILNFIPNIGSVIAVILPLPIAYMQFNAGIPFWLILILPALFQFCLGSLLEPKLLGEGVGLHPVSIVGSLIFWSLVWGLPGAFLAVPITASLRIILSKLEPTRIFADILAGRLPK